MPGQRKLGSTAYSMGFFLAQSDDHLTGKTGATPTVTLSKDNGSYGGALGAVTESANGYYKLAGNATDRNTLGELKLHAEASGADPADVSFEIITADPFVDSNINLATKDNAGVVREGTCASCSSTGVVLDSGAAFGTNELQHMTIFLKFGGKWINGRVIASNTNVSTANAVTVDAFAPTPTGAIPYIIVNTCASASALLPDVNSSKVGGQVASAASTVTFPAAIASPTNITAGVITTVTNLTNAPTAGDLTTAMKASVNAEALDVLNVDTYAEPGQGAPGATISLAAKIGYLFKAWRNKKTQTETTTSIFADNQTTVDQKATVSDDGTTATRGEVSSGP